jgi:hypothetical protein
MNYNASFVKIYNAGAAVVNLEVAGLATALVYLLDHQGCHIFLGTIYQNGKMCVPNNHKTYQMVTKHDKWR